MGRYELVRQLGRGGQGAVYEAVFHGPAGFERTVALKLVSDGVGLVREARLGGLLRHPHLVDVYEVGEADGVWFLAMEHCSGGTLAEQLPLPPRAVVEVGLAIAEALGYAHAELGLVHLDLKPANLLLDGATVKVADLGIARARTAGAGPNVIAGTRGYMAPELVRGAAVDARADIFALGVVLQELASGSGGGASDTSAAGSTVELDALEDLVTGESPLVAWLEPVLARCLTLSPEDRFSSMDEVAEALRALRPGGPGLVAHLGPRAARRPTPRSVDERFVGRGAETREVLAGLSRPGLVTVRGPGGIGKSRLARHAAARHAEVAGVPVWRCDLADARTPTDLVSAIARAVDLALGSGDADAQAERLFRAIGARAEGVLILDTFEHLVDHAGLVARLTAVAPRARVLVTSRVALGLPGEGVLELETLPEADAVELLVATAAERGLDVRGDPALGEIARRVDGVPLALELAAGRLGVLSTAEVAERLSLSLLRSGAVGAHDRSATLRGAIGWSWDLLEPHEQGVLAQLSVFRGGFSLEAAEEVVVPAPGSPPVPEVVAALVDRSLCARRGDRLGLLETVREFAAEHLADPRATEVRHGAWAAALGDPRRAEVDGRRVVADLDNVLAACRRALDREDVALAADTALAAWTALETRGPLSTAIELLAAAGARAPGRRDVRLAWAAACLAAGQVPRARPLFDELLAAARAEGDRRAEVVALAGKAAVARESGSLDEAQALFAEVRDLARELDLPSQVAHASTALGIAATELGRPAEAAAHHALAVAALRDAGDRNGLAVALHSLAGLHHALDRGAEALEGYRAALELHREHGDRIREAVVLGNMGGLLHDRGRPHQAHGQYLEALALHRELGNRRSEGIVLSNLGRVLVDLGRPGESRTTLQLALEVALEVENRRQVGAIHASLGELDLHEGRLADARRHYDLALVETRELKNRRFEGIVRTNLAVLDDLAGRPEAATAGHLGALEIHREVGNARFEAITLASLGHLHAQRGGLVEARALVSDAVRRSRALGDPAVLGHALGIDADLHRRLGEVSVAADRFREGAEVLREAGQHQHLGVLLCRRARLELDQGRREDAGRTVEEAAALATTAGAGAGGELGREIHAVRRELGSG